MILFFTLVIIVGHQIETGSGLRCFKCAESSVCWNKNVFDGKDAIENVTRSCTPPYDKVCIIETYESLDGTVSRIRDCSDGVHFSFLAYKTNRTRTYRRLEALKPNNETACVLDGTRQICLSICNTDVCNGPQIDRIKHNGSSRTRAQFILPVIHVILVVVYNW